MDNNQNEQGTPQLLLSVLAKNSFRSTDQFLCMKANLTRVFCLFAQSECFASQTLDDRANYTDMFEVVNEVLDEVHLMELERAQKESEASKSTTNGRR